MDRVGNQGAHAEDSLEGVGSGTQMGNGSQILKAVALLLKRIVRRGRALYDNLVRLNLEGLLGLGSSYQSSLYQDGGAYV